jgi:hypothetical protein
MTESEEKENLTQRRVTESNNRKVTSMVENLISGLYLVGDVALLGLLVYNSHKSADRIERDRIVTQRKKIGRVVAQRANRLGHRPTEPLE